MSQPSLFDRPSSLHHVPPVVVGNGGALCLRCTASHHDDDVDAWVAEHAGQGCTNYTGWRG